MASIYKRGRIYWLEYKDANGKRRARSLKVRTRREADLQLAAFKRAPIDADTPDILALVEEYEMHNAIVASLRQAKSNAKIVRDFIAAAKIVSLSDFTTLKIQRWVTSHKEKVKNKTIVNYLTAVSGFCRWLTDVQGLLDKNPCAKVASPKVQKLPPRYLTIDELHDVFEAAKRIDDNLLYPAVVLAARSGMRMNEMRQTAWEDWNFDLKLIVIPVTKSNSPRSVPMHSDVVELFKGRAELNGYVFPSPKTGKPYDKWKWVHTMMALQKECPAIAKGIAKGSTGRGWHMFRHTCASHLTQAGVDLHRIAKILGHKHLSTTQRYAHLSPDAYMPEIEKLK